MVCFASVIVTLSMVIIFDSNEQVTSKDPADSNKSQKANDSNSDKQKTDDKKQDKGKKDKETDKDKKKQKVHWGVDSAEATHNGLYTCVVDHFGKPHIFGRYLGEKEGVSTGLTEEEITYLHDKDVKILVIYNHMTNVTSKKQGIEHAKQAIKFATDLGIPKGVAIFADIEPDYPVDTAFLEGWYETIADSPYEPALYGVFDKESELMNAFKKLNKAMQKKIIVWSAFPQEEITAKDNTPHYNPHGPKHAKVLGWQYAIEAEACTIDTNLFEDELLKYVW